ncbi:hypothetical protein D9M70_646940 [compost metagenome]
MAAPARAAPIALAAMSSGVTGRWGDMDGVWLDPVMAQLMMTLFMVFPLWVMALRGCRCRYQLASRLSSRARSLMAKPACACRSRTWP